MQCVFSFNATYTNYNIYYNNNTNNGYTLVGDQTINYDFCLNKLLLCCLLIVSEVVVKVVV